MFRVPVAIAALIALAVTHCVLAEKVLVTSDGGPGKSTLLLANLGSSSKSSKTLGKTTITPAKSGIPVFTAVAGEFAFTVGTSANNPDKQYEAKTYITVTDVSTNTPKVVGFSGALKELGSGSLKGCSASQFGGSFAVVQEDADEYSLYFSVDCLYKCRNKLGGADAGYIVQYSWNSGPRKFGGLKSRWQYQSDPKCGGQVAIFAADIRRTSGRVYALLVDQLGLQKSKLVEVAGDSKLKTVFSGNKCSGGGAVASSTSYYIICRSSSGKGTGVVLQRKGVTSAPVLGGKYTSTQTLYGPQFTISNRLLTIRGPSNSHNPPLKQYIIAHSLASTKIKSSWQSLILLPTSTLSWFDVDAV